MHNFVILVPTAYEHADSFRQAPSTRARFHLDKFSLISFICACGRRNMPSCSLTSLLVEKLAYQLFSKQTYQGEACRFFPSTRANKTCQGENLLVWTALKVKDLLERFQGQNASSRQLSAPSYLSRTRNLSNGVEAPSSSQWALSHKRIISFLFVNVLSWWKQQCR